MNVRKPTVLEWIALLIICLLSMGLFYTDLHSRKVSMHLDSANREAASLRAAALSFELVDVENITLRKLLLERDEPLILSQPKYIIETTVTTVEKEVVVHIPSEDCKGMLTDYTYYMDCGLPVARYTYDGYVQTFTTAKVDIALDTQLDENLVAVRALGTSSLQPQEASLETFELTTLTVPLTVQQKPLESLTVPPWMWYGLGTVTGVALTAGSIKLAGELR